MPIRINELFDQIHQIPQIPEVVRTLITEFNNPKTDFNVIAKNIEKEQVIALKVLRLVNSAHFGLSKKIGTIQEAVVMLGMNQLRTLVIASGMVSAVPKIEGINIRNFWEESFRTATYAKWLAAESAQAPDLLFTAGLISGLGRLLIHMGAASAANEIEQHIKSGHSRHELEQKRLGFTNEQVSAELCKRWHFSPELIETIAHSGDPLAASPALKTACVLHIARYISSAQESTVDPDSIIGKFPFAVAEQIGLSEVFMTDKLTEIMNLDAGLNDLID